MQYYWNTKDINRIVSINEQGVITLPEDLIKKYDLEAGGQIVIEESEAGLILRSSTKFPVEIYSDEIVQKFLQKNEDPLKNFKLYG